MIQKIRQNLIISLTVALIAFYLLNVINIDNSLILKIENLENNLTIELLYDTGKGFNETEKISQNLKKGENKVVFNLNLHTD